MNIKFIEYDLDNGLHVILHKDNSNPLVAVSVLYHVGSKNEKLGLSGFAHFFEHLMFEGSKNIERGGFFKYISSNGGISNAYTTQDETFYYEILPSNKINLALWLESERMSNAVINKKGINTQRNVIKEERKMYLENSPYKTAINEEIPNLLFKKHPYKFPIIGCINELENAKENDYKNFYEKYYTPNNAILSISGDFNLKDVKKYIKLNFDNINKKSSIIKPNIIEDNINKEIFSICKDKNIQIPAVIIAYRIPNKINNDIFSLKIIDRIMSKGKSSRILKNIVNKYQYAVHAGSFLQDLEDYGIYMIYAIPNKDKTLDDLTEIINNEIEILKNKGITSIELEKQINILEREYIIDNDSMIGISSNLSKNYLFYKNTNFINNKLNKYKSLSLDDIKKVANKYLNINNRVRVYNIPLN